MLRRVALWLLLIFLTGASIAAIAGLETYFLPPILERAKADCLKAISDKDDVTNKTRDYASQFVTIFYFAQTMPPRENRHQVDSPVDHECLVAEYTKALARITGWLVIVTGVLGIGTFMTAMAAIRTIQHIAVSERAHISGGWSNKSTANQIFPAINNFGKTPAFITRVSVRVCPRGLPRKPIYPDAAPNSRFVGYEVPPQGSLDAVHVWDFVTSPKDTIFYGGFGIETFFKMNISADSLLTLPKAALDSRVTPNIGSEHSVPARASTAPACPSQHRQCNARQSRCA